MSVHINKFFSYFSAFSLCLAFALSAQSQNSTDQQETVCVRVSVSDRLNRFITSLEKKHFRIFEDNTEQTIACFNVSQKPAPMSVGIVWDVSRSRYGNENYERAKTMASKLLAPTKPNWDNPA